MWLTSELAILGGSGCACIRRDRCLTSFLSGSAENLWDADGQERSVTHWLP